MKTLIFIIGFICIVAACAPFKGDRGSNGSGCTAKQISGGVMIECPDGSHQTVLDGLTGTNGQDGTNGYSSLINLGPSATCLNGGTTVVTALDTNNSGTIDGGDQNVQMADVCNGEDGEDGVDGLDAVTSPFTPVAVIDPCGDAPGIYDEVMLRMNNGQLLSSFSDNASGLHTRFALLIPGSYMTTDGSGCYFSVDASGNLLNEHY